MNLELCVMFILSISISTDNSLKMMCKLYWLFYGEFYKKKLKLLRKNSSISKIKFTINKKNYIT